MSEINNLKMLDRQLQKYLLAYGDIPERHPESALRTQAKFMADLDAVFGDQPAPHPSISQGTTLSWLALLNSVRDFLGFAVGRRMVSLLLLVLVVFGVFLSTGMGATAYAAGSSLPGDALYPLKTTMENVRARWTPDSSAQAHLYLDFAGRRLDEIQALIREGRFTNIDQAAREYDRDLQNALRAIETVAQTQPRKAAGLRQETVVVLQDHSFTLTQMLASAPGEARSGVQQTIHVSTTTLDLLNTSAGDADDDDGSFHGRGGDDDCLIHSPGGSDDDDDCETPRNEVDVTPTQTPQPPAVPSNNHDNNNSNNNGGNNGGGDDDDNDNDDGGGDDDGGDDDDDD